MASLPAVMASLPAPIAAAAAASFGQHSSSHMCQPRRLPKWPVCLEYVPTGHPAKHRGSRKHSVELEHKLQVKSSRSQPSTDSTSYSGAQSSYTLSYLLLVLNTMSQSPVQLWPQDEVLPPSRAAQSMHAQPESGP